jgi:hypothetical protein
MIDFSKSRLSKPALVFDAPARNAGVETIAPTSMPRITV